MREGDDARDFLRFIGALRVATAEIRPEYISVPVRGNRTVVRERVYCYELYHYLRNELDNERADRPARILGPVLMAELDKAGTLQHPKELQGVKPDFVFHVPGDSESDRTVMEVKPLKGLRKDHSEKDLKHLALFVAHRGYHAGIFLVFGNSGREPPRWLTQRFEMPGQRSRGRIFLVWHRLSGEQARIVGSVDSRFLEGSG